MKQKEQEVKEVRRVCDKFMGKAFRQQPYAPKSPPIGCS